VVGPTAAGKSALALAVARQRPGTEIVSVDSMQVYRGMDVGTAKPSASERSEVPHHLVDVADPSEDFSVARFQSVARQAIAGIEDRRGRAVLVGGTGLYVRAVIDDLEVPGRWPEVRAALEERADRGPVELASMHEELSARDPVSAARMEPSNRRRIVRALEVTFGSGRPFSSFGPGLEAYPPNRFHQVGLRLPRDVLDARIAARFRAMVAGGLLAEVEALARRGDEDLSRTAAQALGYRELLAHVRGETSLEEAVEEAIRRTRAFARRQERWFRRDPRITWYDVGDNVLAVADRVLGDW
jgi:tRNA dimethylallyltransferase